MKIISQTQLRIGPESASGSRMHSLGASDRGPSGEAAAAAQ
jgi:hypothetical protein